jgi:predicted PurR-regulated permease PerM
MTTARTPGYVKAVFISLLIIIIIFFMIMAKPILVPMMVSGYIAMLMTSFCNRLERYKIPRSLAAFIALLLCTVVVSGLIYFVVTQLQNFTTDLGTNIEKDLNNFSMRTNRFVLGTFGIDMGMGYGFELEKLLNLIKPENMSTSRLLGVMLGTISNLLLLPVFVFFMLIYRDHFAVFVTKVFARQKNKFLLENITEIRKLVHSYIVGAGKVMLILGIVNTAVLFALGIKHAIFFCMFSGLLNIITYLGP